MKVLVAAASKHGATSEIARHIGEVFEAHGGIDATVRAAEQVERVADYDSVILGSAVYAGHWLKEAKELVDTLAAVGSTKPVWLFSSGPVGEPPKPEEDPVDVAEIVDVLAAREHRVFAGRIDRSKLGFGERALVTALRVAEGDFRDWEQITSWAEGIAAELHAEHRAGL